MGKRKPKAEATRYQAAGKGVICPHCENDTFDREEAMLNKRVSTLINLDWADRAGIALICAQCGLIQWFYDEPQAIT